MINSFGNVLSIHDFRICKIHVGTTDVKEKIGVKLFS